MNTVIMTQNGRVVIPKALREQLGLREGDEMIVEIEDGRLVLSTREARLQHARAMIEKYCKTAEPVVDEFIAERRAAADRE